MASFKRGSLFPESPQIIRKYADYTISWVLRDLAEHIQSRLSGYKINSLVTHTQAFVYF